MTTINSICIYCGSSPGRLDAYGEAAQALAQALVSRNIRLIYGGAGIGIMGTVADQVLKLGGQAIGVIPKALAHKEVAHPNLSELHVTQSMHERKMLMAELADGFIALPGGIGTLEELFEIWTWAQLGFHQKPCGVLNVAGYYDALISFLDHVTAEQFVKPHHRGMLMVESDPNLLLDRYVSYQAPAVKQWVSKDDT
ncbi:TIGR00730 family Rossman fold protein [Methylomonas sp. EFPC1]|uniref:LOG family protein n=1 Tax=unclassified Methylomonas TaxID=2608980 RepID=UPI000C32A4FA|nr:MULTISPECIES: TIGR00730 family Rossman fold protein [unclassified Methylomonas]PKD40257.1 TIGR00730 family Rossman fold protein [Methylomonas sp. Kb3]QSB01454.1 TIGR00730 family Rossman fold protein [Methylomonas sp. EFPC1]